MIMSIEDFVNIEQAKRLKAFGYEQSVSNRFWYLNDGNIAEISPIATSDYRENVCCVMPTLFQACKWLLRSKKMFVQVYMDEVSKMFYSRVWDINGVASEPSDLFDTFEQAQSAGIDVALGLLEKN